MQCPVCRAVYRPAKAKLSVAASEPVSESASKSVEEVKTPVASICRRCGADLSPLIRIHDQALWCHRQALQRLQQGDYLEAKGYNEQAIALHQNNADFHALAGQLWALEGEFSLAVISWQKAVRLKPQQPLASSCLQILATAERYR